MAVLMYGPVVPAVKVFVTIWVSVGTPERYHFSSPTLCWRQGVGNRMGRMAKWVKDYCPSMHGIDPGIVDLIEFEYVHGTSFVGDWYWRYRFDYGMDNELTDEISVSRLRRDYSRMDVDET